jgi:superfamily II DNA or RNA helicase
VSEEKDLQLLEAGQTVRWRGRRWRVTREEAQGFIELVGIEPANRDQTVTPLLALEGDALLPDVLPLPELDVEGSDRARWRALHRAFLTTMAGGREQLVGLDWGAVAVEPYQLVPLMRAAKSVRPRLLIADDTGLGKTAEAGLVLRWLAQRHQAARILIVTRADPEPQRWQREMWVKFGFRFDILRNGADFLERRKRAPTINVFAQEARLIVSMTLAARQAFLDELRQCPAPFDVVVVDEAHHLADRGSRTKRLTLLGRALAGRLSRDGAFLLLTATPHDGKSDSFLSLLRLLDPLVEVRSGQVSLSGASRLVLRRLKSEVTLAGGRKFVQPRIHVISTLDDASPAEKALERPLNAYLDWLAAEESRLLGAGARQKAKGCQFLAGVYRKRFGSSVAALRATLRRRLQLPPASEDSDDLVPFVETEASDPEDEIIDPGASADAPPPPLSDEERDLARGLLDAAGKVEAGRDAKLEAMMRLLKADLASKKVVIFTEYRDTLRAARRRLERERIPFVVFHGDTPEGAREGVIASFISDPGVRIFLGTDAASEGKNLQHAAHHLIHLDVPWNPNRYVQRNGRIDRYGQEQQPHVWVLVAADRRKKLGRPEYRALEVVVEKLSLIEKQLGSVGPVLPGFSTGSVTDVLLRAEADAEERVEKLMDDKELRRAGEDLSRLTVLNQREIEQAEAHVENLGTVDDFEELIGTLLKVAFTGWDDGGTIEPKGQGIVRVRVPGRLRQSLGLSVIERGTFRRDVAVLGQDEAEKEAPEFLSPAHPLVEATLQRIRDDASDPKFAHRFDVEVGGPPGLVLSFVLRFVDGDGRTVEERLECVEVDARGRVSRDSAKDLKRLGLDTPPSGKRPNSAAANEWRQRFADLVAPAREEALRRAEGRIHELAELARTLQEQELEVLAAWFEQERSTIETVALGGEGGQISFESAEEYRRRLDTLEREHGSRKTAIRDRSNIRLAGADLVGGRLIVGEAP